MTLTASRAKSHRGNTSAISSSATSYKQQATLQQARCSAVFLCESCSVRSALALLTSTSGRGQEVTEVNNSKKKKEKKSVCV